MTSTLVRRTAKELAAAFYDNEDTFGDGRVVRTDRFRASVPDQRTFKNQFWKDFVPLARKILAHMLTEPGRTDADRNAIYDALLEERGALTDEQMIAPSILRLN